MWLPVFVYFHLFIYLFLKDFIMTEQPYQGVILGMFVCTYICMLCTWASIDVQINWQCAFDILTLFNHE